MELAPIGLVLNERFLDPDQRDAFDALEEGDHRVGREAVIAVHQQLAIWKGLGDGAYDFDVTRQVLAIERKIADFMAIDLQRAIQAAVGKGKEIKCV